MRTRLAAILVLFVAAAAEAQTFRYRAAATPATGTVFHYTKSNRDGTDAWRLSAFVLSPTRIEVIKYLEGEVDFVVVEAEQDWQRFAPMHLRQWNVFADETAFRIAAHPSRDGKALVAKLANGGSMSFPAGAVPLHIYGFDFMGLNFALPHLVSAERSFELDLIDFNRDALVARAKAEYVGREQLRGADCAKYRLTGPFFGEKKGWLWVSLAARRLERFEHELPTSTDWNDVLVELQSVETMDDFQWQALKDAVTAKLKTRRK
ncbi:MAG TPA: hypothetical protein VF618_25020 [Thermoanaerobaculia bacterium]